MGLNRVVGLYALFLEFLDLHGTNFNTIVIWKSEKISKVISLHIKQAINIHAR